MLYLWNDLHLKRKAHNRSKVHVLNEQTGKTYCQIEKTGLDLRTSADEPPKDWHVCVNCLILHERSNAQT